MSKELLVTSLFLRDVNVWPRGHQEIEGDHQDSTLGHRSHDVFIGVTCEVTESESWTLGTPPLACFTVKGLEGGQ